jgi:hypothetical protein
VRNDEKKMTNDVNWLTALIEFLGNQSRARTRKLLVGLNERIFHKRIEPTLRTKSRNKVRYDALSIYYN